MEISIKDLPEAITDVLFSGLMPYVTSKPGCGKSSVIQQVAKDLQLEFIDVRLSQIDSTEMLGFPKIIGDKMDYVPPKMFPIEGDPIPKGKDGFLVCLEELPLASQSTLKASYKLILDRMVGQFKLHPNVALVATGNRVADKAMVGQLSTALQSRMVHINLESSSEDWLHWANKNQIDTRITSFIEFRPELLNKFDPNHKDNTYPCERTWEFAHKLIKDKSKINYLTTTLLAGTVGEGAAREFKGFTDVYENLPSISMIKANPTKVQFQESPDILYAITGLIAGNVDKENVKILINFVERLPLEFQIITWINSIKRNKDIYNTPEIKQWISKYAKDVL